MTTLPIILLLCSVVTRVIDGDTVDTEHARVRVLGIDCPESKPNRKCKKDKKRPCAWQIPHGKAATERATELLQGQHITLECGDTCKLDYYNRALRYIRLDDGRDLGLVLVQEGLCVDYTKYPHARTQEYRAAQAEAKEKGVGIWEK